MKRLIIIIFLLLFSFLTRGQDIWFIHQEFSPLYSIRGFDDWKSNVIYNENITYHLVEKEKKYNNIWERQPENYKFKYKNIPIEYAIVKIHYENDRVRFINGEFFKEECFEGLDVRSSVTEAFALQKAKEYIGAEQYIWESSENIYGGMTELEHLNGPPKGELVICRNYKDTANTKLSLAYKFQIYATIPHSVDYVYVDAHTGNIVHTNSLITNVSGWADTRYSGPRDISIDYVNLNPLQKYRLRDNDRKIETFNMNKGTSYTENDFYHYDAYWAQWDFDNVNKDNAALDAHWGMMMSYDYFKNKHNRNSFDGEGAKIKSFVHYGNMVNNAGWNTAAKTIFFGDGDNIQYDAFTCLDIVAHEFTHAVTQHTADLVYEKESGAISESISDIFAVCIENYVGGKSHLDLWSIGEDITLQKPADRYLWYPMFGYQPCIYQGPFWYNVNKCKPTEKNDYCGVHTNGGVFNFWFYLLADGGGIGQHTVSGIGIEKAEKFIYRCLTEYFTPNINYPIAAMLTTTAAMLHFGFCSHEAKSVIDAWNAVGINISTDMEYNLIITQTIQPGTTATFSAIHTIQASNIIQPATNVIYRAGEQIILKPGFEAKAGATFHAYIFPCPEGSGNAPSMLQIDDDMDFNQVNLNTPEAKIKQEVILYPNQTNGIVNLSFIENNNDIHLFVYDIMGKELLSQIITDNTYRVDLSSFHAGVFLFRVTSNEYNRTFKVIKH